MPLQAPQAVSAQYAKLATALFLKVLRQVVDSTVGDVVQLVRTLPRHLLESNTVTADSFYPALFVCFLCLLAVHSHILRYIRADLTAVFAVTTVYQIARFHCLVFGISDMQQNGIPSATLTIGTLRLTAALFT